MEQLDFFIVPSPCIGYCQLNEKGYCKGCFRSREERFHWQSLTNQEKRNVIRLCRRRYQNRHRENSAEQDVLLTKKDNPQLSLFNNASKLLDDD